MLSFDFLMTSLILVLIPGTGVIYTVSIGLFVGKKQSVAAAIGCTFGIVPHLLATIFGLATILHTSAVAFQVVKFLGVAYLLYLAWGMYKAGGSLSISNENQSESLFSISIRAVLINILNPKLSIFFLTFLPQFIEPTSKTVLTDMIYLSVIFMVMTFVVFACYGVFANKARIFITGSPKIMERIQKTFATFFVLFSAKLAFAER